MIVFSPLTLTFSQREREPLGLISARLSLHPVLMPPSMMAKIVWGCPGHSYLPGKNSFPLLSAY
jgi:hypothetical protein